MSGLRRLRVTELHPNLLCILCGGYYVDATTIVECLHSFCKTCIVRYLESSKFCPICDVQVHKTKPLLSIRPDKTLQDIVYKLVPGLYQNEMCKRRDFYSCHPETPPATPEDGGSDIGRWYILPDDPVSLALHPASSSSSPTCYKSHVMPVTSVNSCLTTSLQTRDQIIHQVNKNLAEGHVRYLQCPAGVSVAQLKRLLRAKFGVGPSHPMALLTCSSNDPLHDTLTLVDVAYITSWQRTEPLQLFYRIYERASKKIKLDPDSFNYESINLNEEMPKLEPSVGGEVTNNMYGSSDLTNSLSDYSSAPLLQAVEDFGFESLVKKEPAVKKSVMETSKSENAVIGRPYEAPGYKDVLTGKPKETAEEKIKSCAKDSQMMEKCDSLSQLTQGTVGDSDMSMDSAVSASSVVDTIVTYPGAYTTPSNGVSVGVAFVPGELGYISPAGVPCAIIPSSGCVPVTGNCIPSNANIPVVCKTDVNRQLEGDGEASVIKKWNTTSPVKEGQIVRESTQVPADVNINREGGRGSEEDEGKEVQLKISESGVISVRGRDTTVEGMLNSIESEACELLSKIESGSLCEDFVPRAVETLSEKNSFEVGSGTKKSKAKDKLGEVLRKLGDGKVNKDQVFQKGEKIKSSEMKSLPIQNQKSESSGSKETKGARSNVNSNINSRPDIACNDKALTDSIDKGLDRRPDAKKQGELQNGKELRDGNIKDSRSSHIPASLTAASMANLNKPHLKAGTSKIPHGEDNKNREQKSNNGLNSKKEGKQDSGAKSSSGSGCRKSSQPYGYKTLKTPPKSWNPTISREQLALVAGKSIGKGNKEPPRTNKFFKARNAPRFLGNPSAGVKPMYSGTGDSNGSQKRNVVFKLDPKTLGPVTVPVNNDVIPPTCPTSSVSSSTSSVSSVQATTPGMNQTALSALGSLSLQSANQKPQSSMQTCTSTAENHAALSRVEDTLVTSTKAALTLPTSLSSGIKESTNNSSKVIGNTNTLQDSKNTLQNNKTAKVGRSSSNNNSSTTNRNVKLPSAQIRGSNSKHEISGVSVPKSENKTNGGTVGLVGNTMTSLVASNPLMNQLKLAASTAMTTGTGIIKADTVNSLTVANTGLQPQQHLTLGSPTVGVSIIPSCGVSFPGAIGTLPLPYYSNPSLSYPAYPYLYQGAETIGLIPSHPSASYIPTFPACLPPRSPLSPRNIGGAKMMPELPLQSSLLPMVPLVSQVPAQAMSPRPMTPPSPRTPTSSQSPRPYPAQSPRQSNTNQSRPLTPQSPKPVISGQSSRPQTQSPKSLSILQPAVTQSLRLNNTGMLVTQPHCIAFPGQSEKFQPVTQQMSSFIPSIPESLVTPTSSSFYPQNSYYKQNACVQTSVSHTSVTPKSVCNTLNSSKPPVPQSPRAVISNQPGVCLMQTVATTSSQSSTSHTPHSPKLTSPQSPRSLSSPQCTVPQTHVNSRLSYSNLSQSRYQGMSSQQTEGRISNINKNKTKSVEETANRVVDNVTHGQPGEISTSLPSSLISSSLLPVSQVSSPLLTSGLNIPITSGSGNKMHLPPGTHVSLSSNISSHYPNSILNSVPVPLANTVVAPEVSTAAMSFSMCTSTAPLPISLSNVSSSLPLVTYNTSAPSVPTCPVSIPQAFYPGSSTLSINLPLNTVHPASHPLSMTQTSQSTSTVSVTAGHTPKSSASVVSVTASSGTGVGSAPCRNTAAVTLPTENTSFSPTTHSSSNVTISTSSVSALTQSSCTTAAVNTATVVTKSSAVTSARNAPPCSTPCTSVPMITAVTPLVSTPYVPLSSTASMPVSVNDTASSPVPISSITSMPVPLGSIASTSVPQSSTSYLTVTQSSTENKTVPQSTTLSLGESLSSTGSVAIPPGSTANTTVPQSNMVSTTVPQRSMASTTVPQGNMVSTTVPQSSIASTVPQSSVASTTVPQSSVASTTVPQNSIASTVPHSSIVSTVPQSSMASTTVPQSSMASTTVPQSIVSTVPQSSMASTTVPQSSMVSTTVPLSSTANTTVSMTNTEIAAASIKSTGVPVSKSAGNILPVSSTEITTVSPSCKTSTTVPVSSKSSTNVALGSTTGTTLPVVTTPGISVLPSSTVGTSISISSTAGIAIPLSSKAVLARSQNSGCFTPCGTAGGNSVSSVKERGGSEPQSSACTPVCDVTHVIDAKQQCAEPSVSSSGGPRPCLKS
ncbi:flocculation protein FLO11-like isoform X2 [Homarus americanus]|nr:flocculation protein FLO11-like isoform X2 [Homarus americanus]